LDQLRALVGLRWRMVRSPRARAGLSSLLATLAVLAVAGVLVGQSLPPSSRLFDLLLLLPTMFVVFAGLSLVPPLVAGGGNELFPDGQLVAYPITSRTMFLSGVVIAPLNLAWMLQVLMLLGAVAAVTARGPLVLLALVTTVAYIVLVTVAAQALGWASRGVRGSARGRTAFFTGLALLAVTAFTVVITGRTTDVFDRAPTRRVALGALAGAEGRLGSWFTTTLVLLVLIGATVHLGFRACDRALRLPAPRTRPELAPVVRRGPLPKPFLEIVAVDLSSVWRSTSLWRGLVALAVMPGGVTLLADPSWSSLALLPGLVASGAGLLFGVNAFCLDGSGAVFAASLPHPPRLNLLSKLFAIALTCLAMSVLSLAVAATRLDEAPVASDLVAVLGSVVCSAAVVVATCARLSVTKPHKADLRGPRDTPPPPAAMAVYSMQLALATTWAGLTLAGAGASGSLGAAVAACAAVLALAARSLVKTWRAWQDPGTRSRVVTTVAFG
jgi:hypothetical protein